MGWEGIAGGEMMRAVGQAPWPVQGRRVAATGQKTCPTGLLLALLLALSFAPLHAADPYLFAYFMEPAKTGVYFALSQDGYHYAPLHDGKPWLPPSHEGELMRDAFLTRGPDGEFHIVWHGSFMS